MEDRWLGWIGVTPLDEQFQEISLIGLLAM